MAIDSGPEPGAFDVRRARQAAASAAARGQTAARVCEPDPTFAATVDRLLADNMDATPAPAEALRCACGDMLTIRDRGSVCRQCRLDGRSV